MLSESITDKRAEVTVKLMDSLAAAVEKHLAADDTGAASKIADSLTMLIVKTHEVEAIGSMADSASKLSRGASRISRKMDLGDLD